MNYFSKLIGHSVELQQVINIAKMIASTDVTVLIEGDTGTGKELLAEAIHKASPRGEEKYVVVNCATLSEQLAESQLFGHKKGAFTGADKDHLGFIREAEGGTLVLDEIGELSLSIQAKLLRFIEYGECQSLGESRPRKVNVRVLAATNRNLLSEVECNQFREDLYYRLKVVPLELPALSKRTADIPALIYHFLGELSAQHRLPKPSITNPALKKLQQYGWPGNVRELKNLCESLVILLQGKSIDVSNLPSHIINNKPHAAFQLPAAGIKFEDLEVDFLNQALSVSDGNKSKAARLLGLTRDVFLYRLKKYSIS